MRLNRLVIGSLFVTSAWLTAGCEPGDTGPADGVQREVLSAAHDGSQYVFVGERWDTNVVGPSRPILITSPDGRELTVRDDALPAIPLNSVAFGDGVFLAVGGQLYQDEGKSEFQESSTALFSTDGETWSEADGAPSTYLTGVAFGNGTFVAVDADGGTYHSADGQSLTPGGKVGETGIVGPIAFGAGVFVICGGSSAFVSSDGSSFTEVALPTDGCHVDFAGGAFRGVGWANGDVEEAGDPMTLTSADGMSWSSSPADLPVDAIAEKDGTYVGVSPEAIHRSSDAKSWSDVGTFDTYHYRYEVIAEGGQFVVIGRNEISLSPDGETFESVMLP